MKEISYIDGSAVDPQGDGRKVIAHIVNDAGKWGSGFVMALSSKWPEPAALYQKMPMEPGVMSSVQVEDDIAVVNMVAQHGVRRNIREGPAIDYDALCECLHGLRRFTQNVGASVHMPRIGAGRAGGNWTTIEALINGTLVRHGVDVTVYDLPNNNDSWGYRGEK